VLPLTIAYVTFMHGVFFFGDPRYHAPLVPVFAILAAAGLRALWRRVRRDSTRASGTLTLCQAIKLVNKAEGRKKNPISSACASPIRDVLTDALNRLLTIA